jgi:hypothetical protein
VPLHRLFGDSELLERARDTPARVVAGDHDRETMAQLESFEGGRLVGAEQLVLSE